MAFFENATEFFGRPAKDWTQAETGDFNFTVYVPRIRLDSDETPDKDAMTKRLEALLALPEAPSFTALVIGNWGEYDISSSVVVDTLVRLKDRLPNLVALFLGDITYEENMISSIMQSDISPLWPAFPNLKELVVRGSMDLVVGNIALPNLQKLVFESGGLSRNVVKDVIGSSLPALTHLELWLGSEQYGSDSTAADFEGLKLAGMPALTSLGLRDCDYADDLAKVLAAAPVLKRIKRLDLSLGTLGDAGAEAILAAPAFAALQELDLHRHYITEPVMDRLSKLGPKVNLEDQEQEDDMGRYVWASE